MTTITQKKNYKTPHCIFVSLEEEANLLAGSIGEIEETPEGEKERYTFGLANTGYNDITKSGSSPIWSNNWD